MIDVAEHQADTGADVISLGGIERPVATLDLGDILTLAADLVADLHHMVDAQHDGLSLAHDDDADDAEGAWTTVLDYAERHYAAEAADAAAAAALARLLEEA
jgi:hypothetical protein